MTGPGSPTNATSRPARLADADADTDTDTDTDQADAYTDTDTDTDQADAYTDTDQADTYSVEAIRVLVVAKRSARGERIATINQARSPCLHWPRRLSGALRRPLHD